MFHAVTDAEKVDIRQKTAKSAETLNVQTARSQGTRKVLASSFQKIKLSSSGEPAANLETKE
jgi:hypothetical protein